MDWLQNTPVLVLGLGTSGLAMARWCARHGAAVTVWDSREQPPGAEALAAEHPGVARVHGALEPTLLQGCQLVLKSQGLAPADELIAPLLAESRASGIAVMGELDLFARALADRPRPRLRTSSLTIQIPGQVTAVRVSFLSCLGTVSYQIRILMYPECILSVS